MIFPSLPHRFCRFLCYAVAGTLLTMPLMTQADVRLPALFGNGMVLQQKKPPVIWGFAEPGEAVTVQMAGQKVSAKADASGYWRVTLKPLPAGGPLEITIQGKNTLTLRDVLVGEVWVCSGQSNMEMSMRATQQFLAPEVALPPNPHLRLLRLIPTESATPIQEIRGCTWQSASPQTIPEFCATPYYFGKYLQKELNLPVGIIVSAIGGTPGEAWVSREKLASDPETDAIAEQEILANQQGMERNKTLAQDDKTRWPDWKIKATASRLYNAMIHPLIPYGIAGFAWYQGEGNETNFAPYRKIFPQLISDWRERWGEPDLPFYFCQLPDGKLPAEHTGKRPYLREAQASALKLPHTAMAVLIDAGEEEDNHPINKAIVGERLSRIVLAKNYGRKLEYAGPSVQSVKIADGKAIVTFTNVAGGLVAKTLPTEYQPNARQPEKKRPLVRNSPNSQVEGFALCGADRQWAWADAQINGDTVIVSAPAVPKPVAVRYAWADFPIANLYNTAGLPAAPFRTDDFPYAAP